MLDIPLFHGIGRTGRRILEDRAVTRRYRAGAVLFRVGDEARGLFIIQAGRVRVLRGGRGRPHVVHTEGPGGTLGEVPLFDGAGYPATAVAQEDTTVLVLTAAAIRAAMAADPAVAMAVAAALARRVRLLVERLDRLAAQDVTARLAAYLLERRRDGAPFTLGETQQELAEELGTVREVVVRSLRALRRRGLVGAAGRGRLKILDRAALAALAEGAA
jgi:CRP-like cAMP-binding protein